jgi:hypothetical protein
MSYIKPKLVEPKIAKLITNKLENKKNKFLIENQIKEQEIIQNNIQTEPFHKKIINYLLDFFKTKLCSNYYYFSNIYLIICQIY